MVVFTLNLKEFGVQFAKIREASGYSSQRELAEASGVSHSTINRIESGTHKTNPDILRKLAPYLKGVTYEQLLELAGILDPDSRYLSEDLIYDPDVQFIARSKQEMSPEAFRKLMELTKLAKELVVNETSKDNQNGK